VRRHAKATLAGSTFGRGFGLATIRRAVAARDALLGADGSSASSVGRFGRAAVALAVIAVLTAAFLPAFASADLTRTQTAFSPITGSGSGLTIKNPSGMAIDESNGNIFLNDGSPANAIDIFGIEGGAPVGLSSYQITGLHFNFEPSGIAFDNSSPPSASHGAVYTTDVQSSPRADAIRKYVRNAGTEQYEFTGLLHPSSGAGFSEPLGIATDSHGNVYVADYGSASVVKFSPTGTQLARLSTSSTVGAPSAVALDAAGDLFVQGYGGGAVYEYPVNGSGELESTVHDQVVPFGATGVTVDSATNRLFIPFSFPGRVVEYNATTLDEVGQFGSGVLSSQPTRVSVNEATGRIYVADNGSKKIFAFGDPVVVPGVSIGEPTELVIGKVTLHGAVNAENVPVTECTFEYGTSTSYGSQKTCEGAIPTDASDHPVSAKLAGLQGETEYHFRLSAKNANGKNFSVDGHFQTPPALVATEATNISGTKATLHGIVDPGGVEVLTCKFEYGRNFNFESTVPCAEAIPTDEEEHAVSAAITHLLPNNREYQFRVVTTNAEGTFRSPSRSFQTQETVKTLAASNKTAISVTLNGSIKPDGVALTKCEFEWGTTTEYGNKAPCSPAFGSIPADTNVHSVSAPISGLVSSGTYHYRLVTATADGETDGADVLFHTLGPLLEEVEVSFPSMTDTTATIKAVVNPQGQGTAYRFEYLTQAKFDESGYAGAQVVPAEVKGIGHGEENVEINQLIPGLTPATHYHARIVISSLGGTVTGPDLTFATFPRESLPPKGSCPNEQWRTEASAKLPDCRAYEQASPVDKDGNDIGGDLFHTAVSPSGDAVTMQINSGIPGGTGTLQYPTYVARRGATNWSTTGTLVPPQFGQRGGLDAFTPDLRLFFNEAAIVGEHQQNGEVIHDLVNGSYQQLFNPMDGGFGFTYDGASTDDSKIFFEKSNEALPVTSGPQPAAGENNLYLFEPATESMTLAGVLPASEGGEAPPHGAVAGTPGLEFKQGRNAMSKNGDRIYFTAGTPAMLYLRKGLDGPNPETVLVSKSEKENGSGPGGVDENHPLAAKFWAATPDGETAFFTSREELTNESNTGPPPTIAIGRSKVDGTGVEPSFIPTTAGGVAVDAGFVYWTNPSANTIGRSTIGGGSPQPNFITGAHEPKGIAVDGSHIYWTNTSNGTIGRAELGGGGVNQSCVTGATEPLAVAVDSGHIYWTNSGSESSVGRANLACGEKEQDFTEGFGGQATEPGIAVNGSKVYWMYNSYGYSRISCANVTDGSNAEGNCHGLFLGQIGGGGVAVDGSHLYWTQTNEQSGGPGTIGRSELDGSNINFNFVPGLDHPTGGLAVDASHLYWATNPPKGNPPGNDLYAYSAETEELTDLTVDNGETNGAGVQGVVGASDDGSRVYFVANGDLDGGGPAKSGNCHQLEFNSWVGSCSLYLWENGEITFVAPMDVSSGAYDWTNWQQTSSGPFFSNDSAFPSAMVSADGSSLVFTSDKKLSTEDNVGPSCFREGNRCREYYRFHVGDSGLICITCNPIGAPEAGEASLQTISVGAGHFLTQPFIPRNLSASGNRFFFETSDKLVPSDTNGDVECPYSGGFQFSGPDCQDVYEWEADGVGSCHAEGGLGGCYYLISTGKEPTPTFLAQSSESGNDVMFFSHSTLVPQDQDALADIYDASVGGGLAAQHPVTPPHCEGEGCREEVTSPPGANGAGTAVFEGPENPAPKHKCEKGFVRQHGECVKKSHHKRHKKHHHRHANKTRRTSR
jgi:hypothetical protein